MIEVKGEQFIHFHIPKTGGTSVRASLVEHFGAERVGHRRPDGKLLRVSDLPLEAEKVDRVRGLSRRLGVFNLYIRGANRIHQHSGDNSFDLSAMETEGISVAIGHFAAEHITDPVAHIPRTTIVREPLRRAWSHFAHWRDSRGLHDGPMPYSSGVSFEEFATHPDMANLQSRQLGDLGFSVVGASSNIPGFFEALGLDPQTYLPVLNRGTQEMPSLDPGFVREFEDANRADYELHAAALQT